jgi:hypothetical protein
MVLVARFVYDGRNGGCRGNGRTCAFVVAEDATSAALALLGRRTTEGNRRSFGRGHDGRENDD